LLLLEILADAGAPLHEMIAGVQKQFGPTHYVRNDLRLRHPVAKTEMVARLCDDVPATIGGSAVRQVQSLDGVKYLMDDDGWLLIRPSGTEPVLRVYAESRSMEGVEALLSYGQLVAAKV